MQAADARLASELRPRPAGAIVLLSGGLDSATTLALLAQEKVPLFALSFRYGQRQTVELAAAEHLAHRFGVRAWQIIDLPQQLFAGSALTDTALDVPKTTGGHSGDISSIPITYVPARNALFLAHALSWAESLGVFDIYFGANSVDYSGYPDCRPAFVEAFAAMANLATRAADGGPRFAVHAPLMPYSKAEIIARGLALGVDYAATHSCYDPQDDLACGRCDACVLRRRGFAQLEVQDPTRYASMPTPPTLLSNSSPR